MIKVPCLQNEGVGCANKTTCTFESITLLNKNSCQGGWGYVWHQIRFGYYAKWFWMSVTSHGKYLWPPGTEKETGSPWEPLWAISPSASSSTPLGLCLYLACVCVCVCTHRSDWVHIRVFVWVCVFATASCPCSLSLAAPLEAADAISWRYCGSPCCE